ncbi:MAG: DUF4037 domain-containing protein [Candidatus Latescibacterota bacterium]
MRPQVRAYFEETVLPLIARLHPEVLPAMSLRVEGSAGEGLDDRLSDVDATLFLPRDLWQMRGGQLQLALLHALPPLVAHPYGPASSCHQPGSWHAFHHSEISVHPWSELLDGQAEGVLAGQQEVPWERVPMEELLQLQSHPVLVDARGVLARLQEMTAPDRYPHRLWVKSLMDELAGVLGEPHDLEKAVRRARPLEAQMILGALLPRLLRIVFLLNRRYYPWRRRLFDHFHQLPVGPPELLPDLLILQAEGDCSARAAAVARIAQRLGELVLESGMLTPEMLEHLQAARAARAWERPHWREELDRNARRAEAAGYDRLDGWVWQRWGWGDC